MKELFESKNSRVTSQQAASGALALQLIGGGGREGDGRSGPPHALSVE